MYYYYTMCVFFYNLWLCCKKLPMQSKKWATLGMCFMQNLGWNFFSVPLVAKCGSCKNVGAVALKMPFSSVAGDMFHFKFQNQLGQKIEDSETWPLQAAKWPLGSKKALVSTISQEIASYWPPILPVCSYRFSAFWLRSKCSICSYQLNIWYKDHVSFSILNWFL